MTRNYIPYFSFKKQRKQYNMMVFAWWDIVDKNITIFLRGIRWACGSGNDALTHRRMCKKIAETIQHEVLHGVIQHQLEKDKFTGQFNAEWPMLNVFDKDYKRVISNSYKNKMVTTKG